MPACGQAVGCGVCDTPELWCGAAGLSAVCVRMYARVLVPPNLYIHTYISILANRNSRHNQRLIRPCTADPTTNDTHSAHHPTTSSFWVSFLKQPVLPTHALRKGLLPLYSQCITHRIYMLYVIPCTKFNRQDALAMIGLRVNPQCRWAWEIKGRLIRAQKG